MSRVPPPSRLALVLALAALAAGCATQEPQSRHRHWRDGGDRPRGASLFVSPFGEPFRAGGDDAYPVARWFAQADANHDGRLTRAEFRDDATNYFHRLDLNGDGVIDGSEITAYERDVLPEILGQPAGQASVDGGSRTGRDGGLGGGWGGRGRRGGGHRRGGGGGESSGQTSSRLGLQGAAPYTLNRQSEPVAGADANFDGKVTLAEFLTAADRHFAELDTAGTGALTLEGLPKTVVQERRQRRGPDRDHDRD